MTTALTMGLTGGIGSGKSTVALRLVALGAHLVDTDAIARALTAPGGGAIPALRATFGDDAIAADGALDRERMRRLAFADPAAKRRLEAVLHPMIGAEAERQATLADGRAVVFDVPLLAESTRWRARVHRVLVVDCREATQIERVARRPGWSAEAARRVVEQQATRAERRAVADAVIFNDGLDLDALHAEVDTLWARWRPAAL
ncbi:MAG: dephospho-CoA kinase [Burkholderiaceae bacterium]|nr:dephospho-CoA kinase [Burkholderiaceae bacterium]